MSAVYAMKKTASVKKQIIKISSFVLLILFSCILFSCSKEDSQKDSFEMQLIDDWRFTHRRSFVIMSIKANGNWEAQVREKDRFSKVVGKKGQQRGTWELQEDNKYLKITVDSGDNFDFDWEPGNEYRYEISSLTEKELVLLRIQSGKEFVWKRISGSKSSSSKSSGEDELITTQTLDPDPFIINLKKRSPYSKDRYICVKFKIIKNLDKPVKTPEELPEKLPVHPSLRENIMFFLSSLEYSEVNTFDKVREVVSQLEKITEPYYGDSLNELKLDNIIVAGSRGSLEEFIIQYPDQMERFGVSPPERPEDS
ncbi:MAG: hypothetical protein ACQEQS_07300 [Thermodesulfobacteriota bacterium]